MRERIRFPADGASAEGYLASPEAGEEGRAGVVVIQEWWGLDDHIKDIAERLGRAGFLALAPDLYDGKVTQSSDEAQRLLRALRIDKAAVDLAGAVSFLEARTGKPVGTVGYCMGGALSLFAACRAGRSVGACFVYYGGHSQVQYPFESLTAPVLGHFAEEDPYVNAGVPAIEASMKRMNRSYAFHTYTGTRHGFFNDTKAAFNAEAARQSWERTLEFFGRQL
ncbi:MAG TPA: dienelactone hydrolase family protein [Vicinamibacteria bacterium]|nr:dienelactone hydrolase family protein [Vicinamibacteria bacterium]